MKSTGMVRKIDELGRVVIPPIQEEQEHGGDEKNNSGGGATLCYGEGVQVMNVPP